MLIKQQIMENFEQTVDKTNENNIERLLNNIKKCGGITIEQSEILFKRYIDKKNSGYEIEDIIERTVLIIVNEGLARHVVNKNFGYNEDLYSVAKVGLIKAIDNFDLDKKIRFATFAAKVIFNEVLMYLRAEKRRFENNISTLSLDSPIDESKKDCAEVYDIVADDNNFVTQIAEADYCRYIERLFVYLSPLEQKVIIYTIGLKGAPVLNQSQIAQRLNIAQSYVSRIMSKIPNMLLILLNGQTSDNLLEYQKLTRRCYKLVTEEDILAIESRGM